MKELDNWLTQMRDKLQKEICDLKAEIKVRSDSIENIDLVRMMIMDEEIRKEKIKKRADKKVMEGK